MPSVEILLNGEPRSFASSTVADLLAELDLANKKVAVELNKVIVRRDAYSATKLKDGDALEVVHFVGGG